MPNSCSGDELRQRSSLGKPEKTFRRKHDRDADCPPNAGAAVIKPVLLHLSGIWWSPLSAAAALGPTAATDSRVKTGSLSQKSPLCVQIQAYWEFCHRASATLKSTKTTALIGSCIFELECPHAGEATKKLDILRQVLFIRRKNLKDFPPFLVARGCTTDSCTNIQYDLLMYECNAQ